MRSFFSIFALVGFLASVLVHCLTFFGINAAATVPWIWILHLGIFVAVIPLAGGKDLRDDFLHLMPRWAKVTLFALVAYAVVNFVLFYTLSSGGTPSVWDGKYVLQTHGKLIRELSEEEYRLQQAYVMRGFSGHWMIFYLVPTLYSWYRND